MPRAATSAGSGVRAGLWSTTRVVPNDEVERGLRLYRQSSPGKAATEGIEIDAKPEAVSFYSRYGFTAFEALEGAARGRPASTPMFLAVRKIEAASAPARRSSVKSRV